MLIFSLSLIEIRMSLGKNSFYDNVDDTVLDLTIKECCSVYSNRNQGINHSGILAEISVTTQISVITPF